MTAPTAPWRHYGPDRIRAALGFADVVEPVAAALVAYSQGRGEAPVTVFAPAGPDGDVHVKSAWLPGRPFFTVKVATWFAARAARGGSAGGGMVAVFDAVTGDLHSLLEDEHHLSDIRTAAAGALAARHLARPGAATLAVIGTGVQAYLQTLAAAAERPIRTVRLWGRAPDRTGRLAHLLRRRLPGTAVSPVPDIRGAVAGADLVVTATASRAPLVRADWLDPGTHVTAVGADDAGKCELEPALLARADRLVVDSRELAGRYGDVARALAEHVLPSGCAPAELGELLAGLAPGRTADRDITVCKLIGVGVQDLAAAEVAVTRLTRGPLPTAAPPCARDLTG